jgi:predicted RNA-binding protein
MSKSESSAIRVTLTMSKDIARSLIGILEGALEEGDRNLADNPELFDKFTVQFHEEMKAGITRDVLDPIHAEFPTDVVGPADLVGHKVFFPVEVLGEEREVEGLVCEVDPKNKAHVIIANPTGTGNLRYSTHWLRCRADHLHIMG